MEQRIGVVIRILALLVLLVLSVPSALFRTAAVTKGATRGAIRSNGCAGNSERRDLGRRQQTMCFQIHAWCP